jgi:phosphate transport system substrate-binding protein
MALISTATAAVAADGVEEFSARKHIVVVASPTMDRFVEASFQGFRGEGPSPRPRVDLADTGRVFEQFCGGLGVDFPDMAATVRRMSRLEFRRCGENNVGDVIEIVLGFEVAGLFAKAGAPPLALTADQVYRALAKDAPDNGGFIPNSGRTWRDIDRTLPPVDIRIVTTAPGTPWRNLLDDKALQAGCRRVPETRAIHDAPQRVARCTTVRTDGRVIEAPSPAAALDSLETLPPGTIAVVPPELARAVRNHVQAIALDGVLPSDDDVNSGEYPLSRRVYYYFKVAHMHDRKGYGIASNLRDFMTSTVAEPQIGPGGGLARIGLTPLPDEQRTLQRRGVALLRPMER